MGLFQMIGGLFHHGAAAHRPLHSLQTPDLNRLLECAEETFAEQYQPNERNEQRDVERMFRQLRQQNWTAPAQNLTENYQQSVDAADKMLSGR